MTSAPANLLAVRQLLLAELGPHGLASAEVGIVGDTAHQQQGDSYHLGRPEQRSTGYSVSESTRDSSGLSEYASGLDVGTFSVRSGGRTHTLMSFSTWCVEQCVAKAPDTRDIREIIYSPDGRTVRRWDRLGRRSSGDDSHLYHTHFSYFRDSTKANRDQRPLFRRYLTTIGLLEDADMTPEEHNWLQTVHRNLTVLDGRNPVGQIYTRMAGGEDHTGAKLPGYPSLKSLGAQLTNLQTTLTTLAGKDFTDESAIVRDVLAGLNPETIAAAVLAKLDGADGYLTREDVEQAVRDAFAGGLAPEAAPQS